MAGEPVEDRPEPDRDARGEPLLLPLLMALSKEAGRGSFVFGAGEGLAHHQVHEARRETIREDGAPPFVLGMLRRTCGTFLTCAPAIYGGASAFLSARRLGHIVKVAERHYVGALNGLSKEATTLEAAMGIEDLAEEIVRRATDRSAP